MSQRQFKGTGKTPVHYDRKVLRYGYSAMISMGKIIPKDWRYVRVFAKQIGPNRIDISLMKLMGEEINAQNKKTHKKNKQNTQRTRPTNSNKPNSRKS